MSNGCVDTLEDEEQIRRMVSFQVQESWMGTDAVYPGLEQEDDSERRRTEDEENTLRMKHKVSEYLR